MKNLRTLSNFILVFALLSFAVSCENNGTATTEVAENTVITFAEAVAEGDEKLVASMAIDGMSCEMMCGGKIAKTLRELQGVKEVEIDFTEMDQESFANVEYDSKVISEKELINAVNAIADGIYQVKAVKVTHYKLATQDAEVKEDNKEVASYTPVVRYKLPNIFSVLARLF